MNTMGHWETWTNRYGDLADEPSHQRGNFVRHSKQVVYQL